jgi:hypothetical protein
MAATWHATVAAVAFASGKSMLGLLNGGAGTRVLRLYRGFMFNNGTAAVTGVLTAVAVRRLTALSAGTGVTPFKHDSSSSALEGAVVSVTGGTATASDIFRRILWSNEEATTTGSGYNNLECLVPFAMLADFGYADANLEPIVCRPGQGADIAQTGSSAVGTADMEFEFTDAAT